MLSHEQQRVKDVFLTGRSIFLTGAAGTGKTFLIRALIESIPFKEPEKIVTALTGCAATIVSNEAKTLASWSGIGIATDDDDKIIDRIAKNRTFKKNWRRCQVLFIDEISMLSKRSFELLDKIARQIRKNDLPFGGIQLVCSGDFHQLPPIPDERIPDSGTFCFKSALWEDIFVFNQFLLKQSHRQQEDVEFQNILKEIRTGCLSKRTVNLLEGRTLSPTGEIRPIELYPVRYKVDRVNSAFNSAIVGKEFEFQTLLVRKDGGHVVDNANRQKILRSNSVAAYRDHVLKLKVGSQVMCTANLDMHSKHKICNGSTGIVLEFTKANYPVVKFLNGRKMEITPYSIDFEAMGIIYTHMSIPLALSWALSIHKSQGCSLDSAVVDVGGDIFESGQVYVALSRVKSLEGLFLVDFDVKKIMLKKSVKEFYTKLEELCVE